MLHFTILWSIWKEINDITFKGVSSSPSKLIALITMRVAHWTLVKEFFNFSLDDITINWVACMGRVKKSVVWSSLLFDVFKFNVNSTVRGK